MAPIKKTNDARTYVPLLLLLNLQAAALVEQLLVLPLPPALLLLRLKELGLERHHLLLRRHHPVELLLLPLLQRLCLGTVNRGTTTIN